MEFRFEFRGAVYELQVENAGDALAVVVAGQPYTVRVLAARPGELTLDIEELGRCRAHVAVDGPRRWVAVDPAPASGPVVLAVPQAGRAARRGGTGHEALEAQMPGVVRRVLAAPGDRVEGGQVLLLLEAMKMEIRISAPRPGRVDQVMVVEGQTVERGQQLVDLAGDPG
ncbi:MAG: biotin/lipoyl-binding protein [Anaerolineales bacterium]|nr:biotin/lipoyl-binding protein [Anaerolineales bacterium]